MTELAQAVVNGLQMGFLYALVAVGLTIIWGLMEMINFAHGEFLMLGMFGAWWLGAAFGLPLLFAAGLALLLFLVLYLLIERTEFGLALQATSEDRDAARLVGIRPQRMFAVAWGLGAALVAVAGAILVNFFSVYPQVGLQFTVLAYAIVALGGFGSILGTLLAALLVGVIQSVTVVYLPPAFKDAFVFASYLLIGLFRPQGLFGRF